MKRSCILGFAALMSIGLYAQTTPEPNRMVVVDKAGNYSGYKIDNIDEVGFMNVAGRVAADIKTSEVSEMTIRFVVTRTETCPKYKLAFLHESQYTPIKDNPAALIKAVDDNAQSFYEEDFSPGEIPATEFPEKSKFMAISLGYDEWGTPCETCVDSFVTLERPLAGDPKVTSVVEDVQKYQFTINFAPNADTYSYYTLAGETGLIQQQYEQFAAWMGFTCFGDMVKSWGYKHTVRTESDTWKGQSPATEYEVFIQACDVYGKYADCDTIKVTTQSLGGLGAASVDIKLEKYELALWGEEQKYSQFITYTPNDQSALYRFGVYTVEQYNEATEDGVKEYLTSDPPMPNMAYWYFYEPTTTDFQIDPNTSCIAVAMARNAVSEWGELCKLEFTTPNPDATATARASIPAKYLSDKIVSRLVPHAEFIVEPGKVTYFPGKQIGRTLKQAK